MSSPAATCSVLLFLLGGALGACKSASDRFNDFGDRVTDAAQTDVRAGQFADIGGEHLVGVVPVPISSQATIEFICTVSLEQNGDGTATADFSFQPISADDDRQPVGDPLTNEDVLINADGTFTIEASGTVDGEANPFSSSDIVADFLLEGVIVNEDLWCGNVDGEVRQPLMTSLAGSTFGAIRIEAGTTGADLPEPIGECPASEEPDAGVPDGGIPDGGIPDGGTPDGGSGN